ncbi:MAG: hypothetical protein K2Z81_15535 [Cyanobacteria bacterium]|nr:hypothetical protein [Cyanobacteriota bacterium]
MFDTEMLHLVNLFGPIPAEERGSIYSEIPAMRNAPKYHAGSILQCLPAKGIERVEATLGGPTVITPYSAGGGYLGQYTKEYDLLQEAAARVEEGAESGDLIYFGECDDEDEFYAAAYELAGDRAGDHTYAAVFTTIFEEFDLHGTPLEGSDLYYLEHLRQICQPAMEMFYGDFRDALVEHEASLPQALWNFNLMDIHRFNPEFTAFPGALDGVIGGDGDFEREQLSFGMVVENRELGIYRIWSRVTLCTK